MTIQDTNSITLIGRLARDPEMRTLPNGSPVLALRVAFSQSRKNSNGSYEDFPGYIDVSYFFRPEAIFPYLSKGKQVAITGRLQYREWQGEHGKRNTYDIVAERVQLLGGRDEQSAPRQDTSSLPEPDEPTPNVPF